jgi:hypothetical protein
MNIAAKLTVPPRRFLGFCERVEDYAAAVTEDCEVFGFTSGEFSLIDATSAIARAMNRPSIVLSTWTAAQAEITHVEDFLAAGELGNARWIVDRSFQNRQPKLCKLLRDKFGDDAIRVQHVHCKFALLDDGEARISVQTSANLNRNMRIENLNVSRCPVFFEAYSKLVDDIFATQMPTAGFETHGAVHTSFKQVAQKRAKRRTTPSPWLTPKA